MWVLLTFIVFAEIVELIHHHHHHHDDQGSKDITEFLDEEAYTQERPTRTTALTQFLDEEAYIAQPHDHNHGHDITQFLRRGGVCSGAAPPPHGILG